MQKITTLIFLLLCFFYVNKVHAQSAVAMPDSYSAQVAKDVLISGGNAIDAAIAAQFVLAVTLPEAGNVGGGGFMTIFKDGKTDFLDYREVAPKAAHRDMYLDSDKNVIPHLSTFSILSSGVPGTVEGMWQAHKKYGSKPWQALLAPAINLASNGFIVHSTLAKAIDWRVKSFKNKNIEVNFSSYFGGLKAGDTFKQPELAQTLKRIAKAGRDGFYLGKTAKIISDFMAKNGGIITEKDLASYQSKWREPLQMKWRDYDVITAPPPSSGGIAILQWLSMFDLLSAEKQIEHNSKNYMHLLSEIGKRVFADRAEYLGDPDFYQVPVQQLLASDYIKSRTSDISMNSISTTEDIAPGLIESRDTTHFSIVDQWGNAISNTTTINYTFGSGVVVEGAGFILNDEMDDFSAKPGAANIFGAVGGVANEIQPNKRMLSSMSPTILLKNNGVELVTGSPGGTTIISSVYQSILNVVEYDMSAEEAVNAPRFHHQLLPKNEIWYYPGIENNVLKSLQNMGYITKEDVFGDVQMIIKKKGQLSAASEKGEFSRGVSLTFDSQ
ncbi:MULTISPECIES: gamma-glutamyltransferase [Thalassotalea]|uniref:Glutathione hydrolase proenzyme n=1 Tax=Thalassotalea castellviae TaxID=3075612 RepID=A0ABU3A1D7_9GAMM|nr:gamma-glutamyltransferase [Thalassotalea sp. W431]MDT0603693.1 gamma-glutamyltransferase [Thalassotalea sp. W431]